MCLYHTYHWSCCPGTAQPAPYYMNSKCDLATASKSNGAKQRRCRIEHRILDGADHDQPCPRCGQMSANDIPAADTTPVEAANAISTAAETPSDSTRYEYLLFMMQKLAHQQRLMATLSASQAAASSSR